MARFRETARGRTFRRGKRHWFGALRFRAPAFGPLVYLPVVIFACASALLILHGAGQSTVIGSGFARSPDGCRVVRVIDGDTVAFQCPGTGAERGRLIGVDTPELFSPGCRDERLRAAAAKSALARTLRAATEVRIERGRTDRYGRRLIRLVADGQPVSQTLIASGHGRPYGGGRRRGWCT